MTRRRLSSEERAAILERQENCCAHCAKHLSGARPVEFDHVIALACGGIDEPENMQALCKVCHRRKTCTEDTPRAAKIKRQAGLKGQRARRRLGGGQRIAKHVNPWGYRR